MPVGVGGDFPREGGGSPATESGYEWVFLRLKKGRYWVYPKTDYSISGGAAQALSLTMNKPFKLCALFMEHVEIATGALATNALTWSFDFAEGLQKFFAHDMPLVAYTTSAVNQVIELFEDLWLPAGSYEFNMLGTHTEIVRFRLILEFE